MSASANACHFLYRHWLLHNAALQLLLNMQIIVLLWLSFAFDAVRSLTGHLLFAERRTDIYFVLLAITNDQKIAGVYMSDTNTF